jgi:hypothetical protein
MGFINIPEGTSEIRMKDGTWMSVPEGATEVNEDDLWSEEAETIEATETKADIIEEQTVDAQTHLDASIARIEKLRTQHPDNTEYYDIAIIKAKEDYQAKKDKAVKDEIERERNKKTLKEMKEAPSPIDRTLEAGEGMGRGAGRMLLGLGKVGQDIASSLSDEEYSQFDTWIAENEKAIKDKKLEGSALVGEVLANILPVARLKAISTIAGGEFIMASLSELGKGKDYKEAGKTGAIAGVTAGVSGAIINRLFPNVPIDEIDTAFKKSISKLDIDDQKKINSILDHLDEQGITKMDTEARDNILSSVFSGKKSSTEVSADVVRRLKAQAKVAKQKVTNAYSEAKEVASSIEVDTPVKFEYRPRGKDEVKTVKNIKAFLSPKYNKTVADLEDTLSSLKANQRAAIGSDKKIYGEAIKSVQDKQDALGGVGIYKKARKLSKDFNTEYTGVIKEGEEATAGATVSKVLEKKYTEEAGEMLVDRKINLNQIGAAAKKMKPSQKQQIVQDILIKDLAEDAINSPERVRKVLSNYATMDKKGLVKLLGKSEAKKLDIQMNSLNEIELAIKGAKGHELSVTDDVLALAAAGATVKLSPYLAARTSMYATKNIISKITKSGGRAKLIARINKVEDRRLRATLMRSFGLAMSSINTNEE